MQGRVLGVLPRQAPQPHRVGANHPWAAGAGQPWIRHGSPSCVTISPASSESSGGRCYCTDMNCPGALPHVFLLSANPPMGGVVTADVKMSEIAEVELTHRRKVASSADTVRRCFRQIAEGGRSERDLRDERGGPFRPGDRRGTGHRPEHGARVSLSLQGVIGWPLLGVWNRQLPAPGCEDGLQRDLAPGVSDALAGLNPRGGVPARRGGTGLCGLLRRPAFAGPGTETDKSGSLQ